MLNENFTFNLFIGLVIGYEAYNIAGSYLFISIFEDTIDRLENRQSILSKPNFK